MLIINPRIHVQVFPTFVSSYCWYLENASISSAFKTQNHGYELFSSVLRGAPMAKSNKILLIWWLYNSESRISTIYTIMHSKRLPWIWLIHIRQRQNSSQIPLQPYMCVTKIILKKSFHISGDVSFLNKTS